VRITSLGSGSKGNSTLIEKGEDVILIDSGFSAKELESRLKSRNIEADQISAVLVTHEHSDHFKGVSAFSNKYKIPCWLSRGTSLHHLAEKVKYKHIFCNHTSFAIGQLSVTPVIVPHDSREACQFVIDDGFFKVGLLTDLGHITPHIRSNYQNLDAVLIEYNHDFQMLQTGRYPAKLKARVGGNLGHLNNLQANNFLNEMNFERLRFVAAMHLSEENNSKSIVEELVNSLNMPSSVKFVIADQDEGFDWFELQ